MSKEVKNTEERVNPIRITDNTTGKVYELDFNRDAVRFAEMREFELEHIKRYPNTKIPEFFFYAFRKNHKSLAKSQTDELLEKIGGVTPEILERLILLYNQAALTHVIANDEDNVKNENMTVEL